MLTIAWALIAITVIVCLWGLHINIECKKHINLIKAQKEEFKALIFKIDLIKWEREHDTAKK